MQAPCHKDYRTHIALLYFHKKNCTYQYPFGIVDERCKYDNTQGQEKDKE